MSDVTITIRFQSPRGDFGFLKAIAAVASIVAYVAWPFQSPRGDFGFLKRQQRPLCNPPRSPQVSIPSRGFWFFEAIYTVSVSISTASWFQSPRGDFGFLKKTGRSHGIQACIKFQSPRGDFGFLKAAPCPDRQRRAGRFQSPRGDFGFLKKIFKIL